MELVAPPSAVAQQTVVTHARQAEAIEGQKHLSVAVRDPRRQQQPNQLLDEILPLRTAHLRVAQIVEPQGWRYRPCSCIVHGAQESTVPTDCRKEDSSQQNAYTTSEMIQHEYDFNALKPFGFKRILTLTGEEDHEDQGFMMFDSILVFLKVI